MFLGFWVFEDRGFVFKWVLFFGWILFRSRVLGGKGFYLFFFGEKWVFMVEAFLGDCFFLFSY